MELNNEIRRKKDLSALTVLKSLFYVQKVVDHFCNFRVFCRPMLSNDFSQAIADWSNLYSAIAASTKFNVSICQSSKTIILLDLQLYMKCIQLQ